MKFDIGTIAKALVAGLTAGQASLIVALTDGKIETPELVTIIVATVVAGLTVYATPNTTPSDLPLADVELK